MDECTGVEPMFFSSSKSTPCYHGLSVCALFVYSIVLFLFRKHCLGEKVPDPGQKASSVFIITVAVRRPYTSCCWWNRWFAVKQ